MRSTVIPAQITTVEDKIAGNLTLTQILLLIAPVFLTAIVYILVPTPMSFNWPKAAVLSIFASVSLVLAIRFKGRLLLHWIIVISKYTFRPKVYVFNKNSSTNRQIPISETIQSKTSVIEPKKVLVKPQASEVSTNDYISILRGTQVAFRFTNKGLVAVKNI